DYLFQAEDGIRDRHVTGVQTCALPIYHCLYTTTPAPEPGHPTSELLQQLNIGKQNLYNRQKIFHTLDYNCSTNILRTELLPVDHRKTSLTISYDSFVKICLVLV